MDSASFCEILVLLQDKAVVLLLHINCLDIYVYEHLFVYLFAVILIPK